MAVAAEVVVADDHLRAGLAHDPDEPAGRFVGVRLPEALWSVVLGRAHHPGVDVAQPVVLDGAKLLQREPELLLAHLPEPSVVLRRIELGHDNLSVLAAGARNADHAIAVPAVAGHDAAGGDRLVVGMGVDGHEGVGIGHVPMIAQAARRCRGRLTMEWLVSLPVRTEEPPPVRGTQLGLAAATLRQPT